MLMRNVLPDSDLIFSIAIEIFSGYSGSQEGGICQGIDRIFAGLLLLLLYLWPLFLTMRWVEIKTGIGL